MAFNDRKILTACDRTRKYNYVSTGSSLRVLSGSSSTYGQPNYVSCQIVYVFLNFSRLEVLAEKYEHMADVINTENEDLQAQVSVSKVVLCFHFLYCSIFMACRGRN